MKTRTIALVLLAFGLSAAAAALARTLWKPTVVAPQSDRGGLVFAVQCASCHGPDGHGDGPAAAALKSPPPDFAAGWKHGTTTEAMRRVILHGIPGTAMPGSTMSDSDLDAVVAFVRSLGRASANPLAEELRKAGFVPDETRSAAREIDLRNASSGEAIALADFKGKVVLLTFWGTDCVPCLKELPHLEQLSRRFAASDFAVVAACADDIEGIEADRVARRHVKDLPVFVDPKGLTRLRYSVELLPTSVLIDGEGRVLGRLAGAADWSGPAMSDLVGACLNASTKR